MTTPIDPPATVTTVDPDRSGDAPTSTPGRGNTVWWVVVAAAVAFLAGCIGWVLGGESSRPEASYNEVDRGFLADMSNHHEQAVEMAMLTQGRAADSITDSFAREVVAFQRWELGQMQEMLAQSGTTPPEADPERITMAWMDMPTPLSVMPGMASPEQMVALGEAGGRELDRQFLTLMREHHRGGVHMAEEAARDAANPRVRDLATRMARNQQIEVEEYTQQLRRLGFE